LTAGQGLAGAAELSTGILDDRGEPMTDKPNVTLPGKVDRIIPSPTPREPEKAQITVDGADHLYKEIRIENSLKDENGKEVRLKRGAEVEVTVEADKSQTIPASAG
jgi:hypothetical protein